MLRTLRFTNTQGHRIAKWQLEFEPSSSELQRLLFPLHILLTLISSPYWVYLFKISQIYAFSPSLLPVYVSTGPYHHYTSFALSNLHIAHTNLVPPKNQWALDAFTMSTFLSIVHKVLHNLPLAFIISSLATLPSFPLSTGASHVFPLMFHAWLFLGLWIT